MKDDLYAILDPGETRDRMLGETAVNANHCPGSVDDMVTEVVRRLPDTVVVMVRAYTTVGKERIFKAIADGLESKVWGEKK